MLRDTLKSEIDQLSEEHLEVLAKLIEKLKAQSQYSKPLWKRATPQERAKELRQWASDRATTQRISLPDEAFDRGNLYD